MGNAEVDMKNDDNFGAFRCCCRWHSVLRYKLDIIRPSAPNQPTTTTTTDDAICTPKVGPPRALWTFKCTFDRPLYFWHGKVTNYDLSQFVGSVLFPAVFSNVAIGSGEVGNKSAE